MVVFKRGRLKIKCLEFHVRPLKQANLLYDMASGVVYGNEEVSEGHFKNIEHFDNIVKQGRSLPGKENVNRGKCEVETDKANMTFAQVAVSYMGPKYEEINCWTANPVSKTDQSCAKPRKSEAQRAEQEEKEFTLQDYNMSHPNRGKAIIMNNKEFQIPKLKVRNGTDQDASALNECLSNLGFKVARFDSLTAKDMRFHLKEAAALDHRDNDCFILAIMSHGGDGYVYGTDARIYIEEIIDIVKGTISLAGKPKIVIIQACRGNTKDGGIEIDASPERGSLFLPEIIPTMADFLIFYSTVPGYVSYRCSKNGSWFIQSLVKVLKKLSRTMDLLTMMTIVNQSVARMISDDKEKQISCVTSMLTKKVYFTDKKKSTN